MAKIALINDLHFGMRGGSLVFQNYASKFYNEIFFPYLKQHNIKNVAILGDIFDIRKSVSLQVADKADNELFYPLCKENINVFNMIGNHDAYFKNDLSINTMRSLYNHREYEGMRIIDKPQEIDFDGAKILFLPWIAAGNYTESMRMVKKTKAQICFMHAEFAGYEMYKGNFIEHGMDDSEFSHFDVVLSGHYHHKSSKGNIHYLGTQFQITWADYDDTKGFHVFDTETRELEFIKNPFQIFHKVYYNDSKHKSLESLLNTIEPEKYAGCYVKLIVEQKTNPFWFDRFFDTLEKSDIVNLQIVDETLNLYTEYQNTEGTVEDTLTILNRYIEGLDVDIDKSSIESLVKNLYEEANSLVEQQ